MEQYRIIPVFNKMYAVLSTTDDDILRIPIDFLVLNQKERSVEVLPAFVAVDGAVRYATKLKNFLGIERENEPMPIEDWKKIINKKKENDKAEDYKPNQERRMGSSFTSEDARVSKDESGEVDGGRAERDGRKSENQPMDSRGGTGASEGLQPTPSTGWGAGLENRGRSGPEAPQGDKGGVGTQG